MALWKPACDCHLTYANTALTTTVLEFTEAHETFDTTNDKSNGYADFGVGARSYSLRFDCPQDSETPANGGPTTRDLLDASWTDGFKTYTGKARITSASRKGGGRGGYIVSYNAQMSGEITIADVTPPAP